MSEATVATLDRVSSGDISGYPRTLPADARDIR